ncbi:MAG: sulfatase-like hydrolase/transferase [Oscillospiraceae bacterium]|nr:sulfatase-like hydrolase/transferase [Oscillospiraceae bacterium]
MGKKRAAAQTGGMTDEQELNVRRCYAASVQVVDRWIGNILDILEQRGLTQNTVIMFCADHGELLAEHGLLEKKAMYEASVRIPLIISAPWMTQREDCDALAQLMDLAPTCMELAGLPYDKQEMDARSLLALLQGDTSKAAQPHEVQISELLNSQMIFDGRYKWIRNWNDTDELYDLENDPCELTNIIAQHPEIPKALLQYTFRQ